MISPPSVPPTFATAAFRRLQAHWYGRLRAAGFMDVEVDEQLVSRNRDAYFAHRSSTVVEATAQYYACAAQYLEAAAFASPLDRRLWELHAEGRTIRAIASKTRTPRATVARRIKAHRQKMLGGLPNRKTNDRDSEKTIVSLPTRRVGT